MAGRSRAQLWHLWSAKRYSEERGRNFLNPATVALAFFMFSFPGKPFEVLTPAIGLSVVPGALLLLLAVRIDFMARHRGRDSWTAL